jgi:transposase-like protein
VDLSVITLAERTQTEAGAYALLEEVRWGDAPTCPHCRSERAYFLRPVNGRSRTTRTGASSERRVWKCGACRRQFTVLVGTVMHGTKISLRKWLFVVFEMCTARNGIAAPEIARRYRVSAKSARLMAARIRDAVPPQAALVAAASGADDPISLPPDIEAALRALLRADATGGAAPDPLRA